MILDHKPDGVAMCDACYKRELRTDRCASCKNERRIHGRDERDQPLCQECYERDYKTRGVCDHCTELRALAYRGTTCRRCYHKYINVAPCSVCGNTSNIATFIDLVSRCTCDTRRRPSERRSIRCIHPG